MTRRGIVLAACVAALLLGLALCAAMCTRKPENTQKADTSEGYTVVTELTPAPTLQPTPVPTPTPQPTPTPHPWEAYFAPEGEEVYQTDVENGRWEYRSYTLAIEIERVRENKHVYYVADIRTRYGEQESAGFGSGKYGAKNEYPFRIARRYGAVYAQNGDFVMLADKASKGIIIRNGIIYNDKGANTSLAFMPDGTLQLIDSGTIDAQTLLEQGVSNVFSFGPALVIDGELTAEVETHRLKKSNPRSAIGMIEPHHYLAVVAEGRKDDVIGMKLTELAQVFAQRGCVLAYNLDGGASAAMALMGETISVDKDALAGHRAVPDVLMFGTSPSVPSFDKKK